jgi:Leucine-rich repeat (LRR) protein
MLIPQTEIIITKDGMELARKTLRPGDYVIGSAASSDIVVPADDVVERHALLTVNYHELFIEDLSSGRTSVGGNAVTECTRVWPSQKIQIGSAVLEARRIKAEAGPGASLAPETQMVRDLLPAEFLRDKKYDIGGMVAQGHTGEIVDAFEATTGRTVAMKVMLSSLAEDEILNFISEAQITSQLEHPNIIPVHELGVDEEDHVFYTMKLVQGSTLRQVLKKIAAGDARTISSYPLAVLLTIFQKACDAVAFAHSRSIVHRDLKPSNIMIGDYGEVLVMNWGLAECIGTGRETSPGAAQGKTEMFDNRADIVALGDILYQILYLRSPARAGIEPLNPAPRSRSRSASSSSSGLRRNPHLPGGRIPHSLAAVSMKALSVDPRNRYAGVPEVQADITAYQDGFATSAERVSLLTHLRLLVSRHKREATALAASVILLVTLGLGAYAYMARERNLAVAERQRADHARQQADRDRAQAAAERATAENERARADRTLGDLRTAAPAYGYQTGALLQAQKFEEALKTIAFAIALDPDDPDYHLVRAHTFQALQRLPEAADSYRRVLSLRPADGSAKANLEICERLLAAAGKNSLTRSLQDQLLIAIVAQKRSPDAVFLATALSHQADARAASIVKQLGGITQQPKWNAARLVRQDDGTFALDLSGLTLPDLSSLQGLPLSALNIAYVGATDLRPLHALPLTKLDCSGNAIVDLSPLKGMSLNELSLRSCAITELSELRGMPLEILSVAGLPITSLEALRGMPLRRLDCCGCEKLADLSPLITLPNLETLNLPAQGADLALLQKLRKLQRLGRADLGNSLAALENVPTVAAFLVTHGQQLALESKLAPRLNNLRQSLRQRGVPEEKIAAVVLSGDGFMDLDFTGMPLDNLGALAGLPVRRLIIKSTTVSDLNALRGGSLTTLDASDTPIKDLSPLAACPSLAVLDVSRTVITDIRPLAGLKLDRLILSQTGVQDLSPLMHMPLRTLYFDETKVENLLPLTTCTALQSVAISGGARDPNLLRKLPALLRLSSKRNSSTGEPAQSAADFWAENSMGSKTREAETALNAALAKLRALDGWNDNALSKQSDGTYRFNLRDVKVNDLSPLHDLPISILDISGLAVTRLSPVANCPIRELYMEGCTITDLAVLGRLPLERLSMTVHGPGDLQHLRGHQLRSLSAMLPEGPVGTLDLGPLKGMPLEYFRTGGMIGFSIKALEGAPIRELYVGGCRFKDLTPVRHMPLSVLDLSGTQGLDISVLRNLPLTRIDLIGSDIGDVSPLASCKSLETIGLPYGARGVEKLRQLPNVKRIAFDWQGGSGNPQHTAAEFWAQFDKQKKP